MNYISKRKTAVLVILAFTLVFFGNLMKYASAHPTAVRVEAPVEIDPAVTTTFNVSIIAEDVLEPGFFGWEVNVTWTAGAINCTAEIINSNLWGGNYLGPWVTNPIDNVAGRYHQSLTGKAPGTPEVGTRWLVNLTFQIVQSDGYSVTIYISPWAPAQYCIADQLANEIQHDFIPAITTVIPEFLDSTLLLLLMMLSAASLFLTKGIKKN
jgi:hypothetical protein